jgi:hypothetical protein
MVASWDPCSGCLWSGHFLTPIGLDSVARHVERSVTSLTNASTKLDLGAKSAAKASPGPFHLFSIACVVSFRLRPRLAIS